MPKWPPQGTGMICVSPVSRFVRRIGIGRIHTPFSTATASTT